MAFTNSEIVRLHLRQDGVLRDTFTDVPVQLLAASPTALLHANLKTGSIRVKGKEIGTPQFQNARLGSQPVSLSSQQLIPDSVVVASDTSLGTIFTENCDYHIDHAAGTLSRLADGAIPFSATVAVWYYTYRLYVEGVDFAIDYQKGTIRRINSGAIEDGQNVFVDYQTLSGGFDDPQIANAIAEADDQLLKMIDAVYAESTDQTLITAETDLALAILCRSKAIAALETTGKADSARVWSELADRYAFSGRQLAVQFASPRGALKSPTTVKGGVRR
jgi:hypothetical protein